jgi:ATP-binding cassette subfamily F protein 3
LLAQRSQRKRLNPIRLRQMQDRQQELEEQISRMEAEIGECESGLLTFVNAAETARLAARLEQQRAKLQTLLGEWEELSVAIESNV